jgi:hypothetical protein
MKGILEFNLPEDREEFDLAQNVHKYRRAIEDMSAALRSEIKYGEGEPRKYYVYLKLVREKFREILEENEIE